MKQDMSEHSDIKESLLIPYNLQAAVRLEHMLRAQKNIIMALTLTLPPTEMSTTNIFCGKGGRCVGPTTFMCRLSLYLVASTYCLTQGLIAVRWFRDMKCIFTMQKPTVGSSVGTAVFCVSCKVAGCFFDVP